MSKTKKLALIPLTDVTRGILKRYGGRLPQVSNQRFNDYLKEVFEVVGLTRDVEIQETQGGADIIVHRRLCDVATSHMGRRYFVSWARRNSIPDAVIQKITGHTNLAELDTYTELHDEDVFDAFQDASSSLPSQSLNLNARYQVKRL